MAVLFNISSGIGPLAGGASKLGGVAGPLLAAVFILVLSVVVLSMGAYFLQSMALFTIAKRREIAKPWLAWLPIGSDWILGCISDQYQYVVKGKIRNRRKALLVISIIAVAISQIGSTLSDLEVVYAIFSKNAATVDFLRTVSLIITIVILAVSAVSAVIGYCAMYDLYYSCDPSTARRNLLLSIFLVVISPVLLFINRNKELGMPPRKGAQVDAPEADPQQPGKGEEEPDFEIEIIEE